MPEPPRRLGGDGNLPVLLFQASVGFNLFQAVRNAHVSTKKDEPVAERRLVYQMVSILHHLAVLNHHLHSSATSLFRVFLSGRLI